MQKLKTSVILLIVGIELFLSGAYGARYIQSAPAGISTISPYVRSNLNFTPFVIAKNDQQFTSDSYKSATVENNVRVLTYVVKNQNTSMVITQYQQPKEFVEVPDYKERFLSNVIKQQSIVQTSNGVIYIGQTAKGNPRQIGVMLERGLIVFLNPSKTIDEKLWQQLGDALILDKK